MGLLRKIFGGAAADAPTQFRESETSSDDPADLAGPRRDMVHVVLRDVMRKHGIPSDWLECRILSVLTREKRPGMHVQFIVMKGEEQLLPYVHAFQDGFWNEIEKFEPRARDWLFSAAWQFEGNANGDLSKMPFFQGWDEAPPPARLAEQDTQPHANQDDDLQSDLARLFAIRDAAIAPQHDGTPKEGGST